jgi:hypothetical protein
MNAILYFNVPDGIGENDRRSLAFHVHFPGSLKVRSGVVVPSLGVPLLVPTLASAVCVTLVKRVGAGWVRHSRCRFGDQKRKQTVTLKDEQLGTGSPAYGSATLMLTKSLMKVPGHTITREWWCITDKSREVLFARSNSRWYKHLEPIADSIHAIHAPLWNNHADVGVPGWCFAFPPVGLSRYSGSDLLESFVFADGLLNKTAHPPPSVLSYDEKRLNEVLSLGLTLFGLSIYYELDHTARANKTIERFSSTARLDGIGDCEDIAKESALAFGDLKALDRADNELLALLRMQARKFQFCICLCTVKRKSGGKLEAHAFGMLIPNEVFPEEMLSSAELANLSRGDRRTYTCDGVYTCHPSKKKVSRHMPRLLSLNSDEQIAPWEYQHVVSAFVYNKGQVFFHHEGDRGTYGASFDALFPRIEDDIVCVNALGSRASVVERKVAANSVLRSNLPRATRMFGSESQTPIGRLDLVMAETGGRALSMISTFDQMNDLTRRKILRLSSHLRAPCLSQPSFNELIKNTEQGKEVAFQVKSDGALTMRTNGHSGSVQEPLPNSATVGGHTHHRHGGKGPYRSFNPPTPEDFISFATRRAWALLNTEPMALHIAAIIVTNANVYELTETTDADGIVTRVYMYHATKETMPSYNEMWTTTRAFFAHRIKGNPFIAYSEKEFTFSIRKGIELFSNKACHDDYLTMIENMTAIRTVCQNVAAYKTQCEI